MSILNRVDTRFVTTSNAATTSIDFTGTRPVSGALVQFGATVNMNLLKFDDSLSGEGFQSIDQTGNDLGYERFAYWLDWSTNARLQVQNNNMTAAEVNQILVECAVEATAQGATAGTLNISGSNAAPDGSSGGFDGDQAVIDLTNLGITVTTS